MSLKLQISSPFHGTPECDDPRKLIVPIDSVARDTENSRFHPERNLRGIRASLRRRGQQTPIVISRDGVIVKGNGTHEAAELEGWTHIWIVVTHLTGAELRAYGISDNATGLSSEWNWEQLAGQLAELKSFDSSEMQFSDDDLGFEAHEISPLLAADWKPPSAVETGTSAAAKAANTTDRTPPDPHADLDEEDKAKPECSIICTPNQRVMIDRAIERARFLSGEISLTEGRCIELICADYCADPNNDLPPELQTKED